MPDPMINANPSAWWKVQRDQCRANVMACVSCGMALGLAHHPLCYTAALAPVDSGSSVPTSDDT